jgi:pimeloyl-ACP methyl ester carboxylesterase
LANSPFSKLAGSAASVVDRAVLGFMQSRGRRESARADAMPHADRIQALRQIHEVYGGDALAKEGAERFFPSPGRVDIETRRVRSGVYELSWLSAFDPFLDAVRERYLSRIENRTARARLYLGEPADPSTITSRPAIIAIHGYMGGQWLLEENQWPIEWLVRRRGLDVALPVLPLHAGRGGAHRGAPAFPSSDPRMTNEGFRQAVTDLRSLIRMLRDRGAPHVGVMGMSLGGYTTSLLATVTNEIDFAMPMIPLASIADFAREQGRLGATDQETEEQHAALERANWIVSPFARPLAIAKNRSLIVAAEYDRITPVAHAARLAKHFECDMMTISGGHLLQIGRSDAFRALAQMLEREGIISPPPTRRR